MATLVDHNQILESRNNEARDRLCTTVKEWHAYVFELPETWQKWNDELYSLAEGPCLPRHVRSDFEGLTSPPPSLRQDLPMRRDASQEVVWKTIVNIGNVTAYFHVGFILDLMVNKRKLSFYIKRYNMQWSHLCGTADCSVHGTLEPQRVNAAPTRCHAIKNCVDHGSYEACDIGLNDPRKITPPTKAWCFGRWQVPISNLWNFPPSFCIALWYTP